MITNKAIMAAYRKANNIPDNAPLFTFAVWKKMGYNAAQELYNRVTGSLKKGQEDGQE